MIHPTDYKLQFAETKKNPRSSWIQLSTWNEAPSWNLFFSQVHYDYMHLLKHDLVQCHSQLIIQRESALAAIQTMAHVVTREKSEQMNHVHQQHEEQLASTMEEAIEAIHHVASTMATHNNIQNNNKLSNE